MAILDLKRTADYITNWIIDYAKNAGVKTLVLGLSGGIDSALVALLCKRTGFPVVCVNMPCRSSGYAFERASVFANEQGLSLFKVDLTESHELIRAQVVSQNSYSSPAFDAGSRRAISGLSSCLRSPVLSYFSLASNGLIVGTGNRSEDNLIRYFSKRGDGCVDISPIADLFKSEVYELFEDIARKSLNMPLGAQAIFDAPPSADLWGVDSGHEDEKELEMTYLEIEWADRENMRTAMLLNEKGIIESKSDPTKHTAWVGYTARQKTVISKIWAMEKASRHKYNPNLPVCKVRDIEGLVR